MLGSVVLDAGSRQSKFCISGCNRTSETR